MIIARIAENHGSFFNLGKGGNRLPWGIVFWLTQFGTLEGEVFFILESLLNLWSWDMERTLWPAVSRACALAVSCGLRWEMYADRPSLGHWFFVTSGAHPEDLWLWERRNEAKEVPLDRHTTRYSAWTSLRVLYSPLAMATMLPPWLLVSYVGWSQPPSWLLISELIWLGVTYPYKRIPTHRSQMG